ncbi:hypothetical protein HDU88_005462 [Geranomyces variabilis]|nr:hypothetical protein HDU88_005462 [Geranomyces variabilis]
MANHTAEPVLPADLTAALRTWDNAKCLGKEEPEECARVVAALRSFLRDVGSTALGEELPVRITCSEFPRQYRFADETGLPPNITGFRVRLMDWSTAEAENDKTERPFKGSCQATFFLSGRLSSVVDELRAPEGALDGDMRLFPFEDPEAGIVLSTDPDPQKQQVFLNGDLVTHRWLEENPDPTYTALCPSNERGGLRFAKDRYLRLPALDPPAETGLIAFVLNRQAWGFNLHVALLDVNERVMYHDASTNYDQPEGRAVRIRPDSDGTVVELLYYRDYDTVHTTVYLAPDSLDEAYNGWNEWPAKDSIEVLAGWVGYAKANPALTGTITDLLQNLNDAIMTAVREDNSERAVELGRAYLQIPFCGSGGTSLLAAVYYNLACAEARLGHPDAALARLQRLEQEGLYRSLFSSWEQVAKDPDFDSLGSLEEFRELLARNAVSHIRQRVLALFRQVQEAENNDDWERVVEHGNTYLRDPDAKQPLKVNYEKTPWLTVTELVAAAQVKLGNFDGAVALLSGLEDAEGEPNWEALARDERLEFQDLLARHGFSANDRELLQQYIAMTTAEADKRYEDAIAAGRAYLATSGFEKFTADAPPYALAPDTLFRVMSAIARCEALLGHNDAAMAALLEMKKASEAKTLYGVWDLQLLPQNAFDGMRDRADFKELAAKDDHWGAPGAKMPTMMWNGRQI